MQAFTRDAVASYMPTVMEAIQAHQDKWDADGHVFAFEEGKSIALDVAMTVLIGLRLDVSPTLQVLVLWCCSVIQLSPLLFRPLFTFIA